MLFCQLDYPQELGVGQGYSIAQFGCVLVSVTSMLVNVFGKDTDPVEFNQAIINHNGFSTNGLGALDIFDWNSLTRIYPDITLLDIQRYFNPPAGTGQEANMQFIDDRLEKGFSVIVGVSFNHSPSEPVPTHFVELYKKNSDGTYQCRDPWFRNAIDANFNLRYAVNGMTVAQCILQVVAYDGQVAKLEVPLTTYHAGDEIHVFAPVPTGQSFDAIDANYGQITPEAPARVIDILYINNRAYYHIDQTYIGGGTGYADAAKVDLASVQPAQPQEDVNPALVLTGSEIATKQVASVPDAAPEVVAPIVPPVEPVQDPKPIAHIVEDKTIAGQRDAALSALLELKKKYQEDFANYTTIIGAGFSTADDILKTIKQISDENTGLKKQLVQVLRRNEAYHTDISEKENEDATAIEVGMKYEAMYKSLKNDMVEIAKRHQTKPTLNAILSSLDSLKGTVAFLQKQLQRKSLAQQVLEAQNTIEKVASDPKVQEDVSQFLSRIFLFSKGVK